MKKLAIALGAIAALMLTGCSQAAPSVLSPVNHAAANKTVTTSTAKSIAALGDSITNGLGTCTTPFNPDAIIDCPDFGWATGTHPDVNSVLTRLQAAQKPGVSVKAYNDAVSTSGAAGLDTQAAIAVGQKADYITILTGTNDLCTPTLDSVVSTKDFTKGITKALKTINTGLPNSKIYISSIPNLEATYNDHAIDRRSRPIWHQNSICQSILDDPTSNDPASDVRRSKVFEREAEFNKVIQAACDAATNCVSDNGELSKFEPDGDYIAAADYFHPSSLGQTKIADIAWAAISKAGLEIKRDGSTTDAAPEVEVQKPSNFATISKGLTKVQVKVTSKATVKRVFLSTVVGNFNLIDRGNGIWSVKIDASKAPAGVTTDVKVVAVTENGVAGASDTLTVTMAK